MKIAWLPMIALCLLQVGPVGAQDAANVRRARDLFKAGAVAYGTGDYLAAIQALERAYASTPLPAIAFSLAQAARKQYFVAHEAEYLMRAVSLYRKYVDQTPNGARRAEALEALSQLEPLVMARGATLPTGPAQDPRSVTRTRLMITADHPLAQVSLDGAAPTASPLIREVAPGKHEILVTANGYYPAQRQVTAIDGEFVPVDIALKEQPATLVVWAPRDAAIYLDNVTAGGGGDAVRMQASSGTHELAVLRNGHRRWSRRVTVKPGEVVALRSVLEFTSQRKASRALIVAGGAALGAGLILSAFAQRSENVAQDLLVQQARRNLDAGELSEYADAARDRNRWRAASVVSLAAAGGLFLTGALLYEFDFPRGSERGRAVSSPTRRSLGFTNREATATLRVAPLCLDVWGLYGQATF